MFLTNSIPNMATGGELRPWARILLMTVPAEDREEEAAGEEGGEEREGGEMIGKMRTAGGREGGRREDDRKVEKNEDF